MIRLAPFLLACCAAAPPAAAQLPPAAAARALDLAAQAARTLAPPLARIEVRPGALDPRLRLAPCARVDVYLPAGVAAWGRSRVGLRCAQGATRWNVYLPLTVEVWSPAVVTTAALPAGARLDAAQLSLAEVDWAAAASPPHRTTQTLQGRVLARPLAAGAAPRAADLQARLYFALGATVRVEAVGEGFAVSSEGHALTPGLEGQTARVRTEGGRVLVGRPVGDHRIEVRL